MRTIKCRTCGEPCVFFERDDELFANAHFRCVRWDDNLKSLCPDESIWEYFVGWYD